MEKQTKLLLLLASLGSSAVLLVAHSAIALQC